MDRSLRAGAAVLRRTCARASTSAWTRAWVPSASTPAAAVADAASAAASAGNPIFAPIRWGFAASHARGVHGSAARFVDERFTPVLETPEMDAEYEKLAEEIRRSPKKRQRFLLLEALRGTRLKPLIAAEHELLKEEGDKHYKHCVLEEYARTFDKDLSRWDTSRVTSMRGTFSFAQGFNQPIGRWRTSSVTDMDEMFSGKVSDQEATGFNQPIQDWDVSRLTDFQNLFDGATAFNADINRCVESGRIFEHFLRMEGAAQAPCHLTVC